MYRAIELAAGSVAPDGLFVIAIYNRHFTSRAWRWIKWLYNHLPRFGKWMMARLFAAVIFCAKLIVTRRNPLRKRRGMSFMVDVVDWIGGYPYEHASRAEIEEFVTRLGFALEKFAAAPVPTGCNEFVFHKRGSSADFADCTDMGKTA
jgi:2-polyprenyl-6-hydroxyphenyl methylase/3-demethylubiquinone-9 3-methyltransferase